MSIYYIIYIITWSDYYGVPFVPLRFYMKNKLNVFGASISKSSFDFEMELRFQNRASISKWSFDFKIELWFRNRASISKWKMELRFQNRASISKWKNRNSVLKSKTLLICLHVTTWKNASRTIEESLTERIRKWWTACGTWERGVY